VVIDPDSEKPIHLVTLPPKEKLEYEKIRELLNDGYMEILYLTDSIVAIIDEEGKLKNLPINERPTKVWNESNKLSNECA